ncbi:TBPIP-domain-containing protein [Conidiobolus coronatus NRRL 28638]|uniref:Homologous-pairing protein 2 homolog n=1 Tax=Conidiobolus coronatus (strain ATCC 28846 / CBS 209.66 / NRRL 28638) TaxID=796925 RepID=A0A137P5U7_CONC2|nr:TBPIP-domain-containing protein [Conidiobolus coronatus NRRL 28638]|eukprot:KXN70301.1 TBPIP-domain-containing protein [Conidiobolus coronatus NRRL 28638]
MPPKKRPASSMEDSTEEVILEYMKKMNRPYSLTDLCTNLHSQIKKTGAQRALESLVSQDLIKSKAYGKQVVYCYNQSLWEEVDSDKLKELDDKIEEIEENMKRDKNKLNQLESIYRGLTSSLTDAQLDEKLEQLEKKIEEDSQKYTYLSENTKLVTDEEKVIIDKNYSDYRKHWKTYKNKFKDIFDIISENLTVSNKDFMEEQGIETDEDFGLDIKIDPLAKFTNGS